MEVKHFVANKYKVILVDCDNELVDILKNVFGITFDFITCSNTADSISSLSIYKDEIALIISNHKSPIVDGIQILQYAKQYAPNSIRILLTDAIDNSIIIDCINICEVYRYIVKPIDYKDFIKSVILALNNRRYNLNGQNVVQNLKELLFSTVAAICEALEVKDSYTIGHSTRVTLYSLLIGRTLGLTSIDLQKLHLAGLLHDIGKIAIPEYILNKPGRLTDLEFDIVKLHPAKGADIIRNLKQLGEVIDWVESHHERYDGRGYPNKLQGKNIPYGASILAVADSYDAMTSDRAYRKGMSHAAAIEEINRCMNSQFDPDVAKAFLSIDKNIEQIMLDKDSISKYTVQNLLQDSKGLMQKLCISEV